MKTNDKVVFIGVIFLLIGIIGLSFYGKNLMENGNSQILSSKSSFKNMLTGAAVAELGLEVTTANCWSQSTAATCGNASGCEWKNDSWGSWCQELNCWGLYSQNACATTTVPGKNCSWHGGGTTYSCEKISCWSFSGTNANTCVNNTASLSCDWNSQCYSSGSNPGTNCWSNQNQSACMNATGCAWGQCMEKGCWSYASAGSCNAAKDWNGKNCTWSSSSNWCEQNGCWKYSNSSSCGNAAGGLNCEWKWNSCMEKNCYSWDFTNASACVNNTLNLSCNWNGGYCNQQDCWSYNTNATCSGESSCVWKTYATSGWCEEVNCWSWDSWNGGNQSTCVNNSYGMACAWSGNPSGNATSGWCFKDMSTVSCSNKTTERDCMDTMYCWWQYSDWSNPSAGGTCNSPGSFGATTNNTISKDWNPGCYVFDKNSTDCLNVSGCTHNGTDCNLAGGGHANATLINNSGINCTMILSSALCNGVGVLSSCCTWQNSTCTSNKLSTSCWDQMQATPEGAAFCEDYNAYKNAELCNQIAGSPWYMPCEWVNSSEKCQFKASDVFGNATQSLIKIDNKKNCEAANGKWVTENYCESNVSIPVGKCENKFDEEDNCDKACFGCESKDSDGNAINSSNAESACEDSRLGYCEFKADTSASNGIGFCNAKAQYKKGIASDCNTNCGDCTYKGNSVSNDTTKRPSYYCTISQANSDGGGCKWAADNTTATGGYCIKKGEKTCQEACDRCNSQNDCSNLGRTEVSNQTGSCMWQGDMNTGTCVANTGEDVEVCWDGLDNTDDGLVDCADPSCYSDTYCGFVSGNCFGWDSNASCVSNGCEWIIDKWGSFCDFNGSQCWKLDMSAQNCSLNQNCQWSNGTGSGWCELDWSKSEACTGLGQSACALASGSGCSWSADDWCEEEGNSSAWCVDHGGWCQYTAFAPKDCWMYQSSSSQCNGISGCSWKTDTFSVPHCEVNWSGNCWNNDDSATCTAAGCWWKSDTWGSWCTNNADHCWSATTQSSCNGVTGEICRWKNESWGGYCEPTCSSKTNSSSCNTVSGGTCNWIEQTGWCEDVGMSACSNTTNSNNATSCGATTGCRWKSSGWCDPKGGGFSAGEMAGGGGGIGSAVGAQCYKYDGNQSLCTNKSIINISCGWVPEPTPRCDVNWGGDCWRYTTAPECNTTVGCWWKNDAYGSSCMNVMDQCWTNTSLQNNAAACNTNQYCNATQWGGCEPTCFSATTSAGCGTGCKWMTGWCNPEGMNDMFDEMEGGAPVPLGVDTCDEMGMQKSVDICGFGLKDMGDAYGFGVNVNDFSNASLCNKEKLSSNVMGMVGGFMGGFGAERIGSGNDTVILVFYLDTDGYTSGGCAQTNNVTALGYEFRFKYTTGWNTSSGKSVESFNAYKCDNSNWKATDIKLSAWKKKMCSEIGGPMIAVEKADLEKFPTLYNSTKDMRIYAITIGNTGNISSPTDSAGPGWTTPGSVDFEISDAFGYGADSAKYEDILKKGYVQGEDCFNSVDDDGDDNTDCNDWDCQYSSKCTNTGVNAVGYVDTKSPQVTGVKIEEYPNAALVMYDTDKPTNGTLELYGADSKCLNKTDTIYDIGLLSENIRDYKLWHYAPIYEANDTMDGHNISLTYPLASGTTYYYKLKVCDSAGKCALSKCSNFKTATSEATCGYCNFVTRIKTPTGWNVSYDLDSDGTYEHLQGQVCGPNAGMKTNYTNGRKANVKIAKSDGSTYIEFINVTLTKTGLNDKVRTISGATDMISDSEKVGLTSDTRDKIVNNLHPEICRIKVPYTDVCDHLYHCDDNGNNCVDRTALAGGVPINATTCVWNAPNCEFSTYKTSTSSSSSSSSSSGGGGGGSGGGGGGGVGATTYVLSDKQLADGYVADLGKRDRMKFMVNGGEHYVTLDSMTSVAATINVTSKLQQAILMVGEEKKFEVSGDNNYDVSVKVNSINISAIKAKLTVKAASGLISAAPQAITGTIETTPATEVTEQPNVPEIVPESEPKVEPSAKVGVGLSIEDWIWAGVIIGIIVLIALIAAIIHRRYQEHKKGER